jgi:hypothetical protein
MRGCSGSSPSPAASPATSRRDARLDPRGRRARLRRCRTPTARRSTTPTCSSPAWSATARPRPARWPPPGTPTSSSTRPRRRGAADPAPQRLQDRQPDGAGPHPDEELTQLLRGYGYEPSSSRATTRPEMHQRWPPRSTTASTRSARDPARGAPRGGDDRAAALADDRAAHAQGLDRPEGGRRQVPVEGTWRAHQVPLSGARDNPEHLRMLEEWLRSTGRRSCSTTTAARRPSCRARAEGRRRMSANPHANGGLLLRDLRPARLPRLRRRGRPRRRDGPRRPAGLGDLPARRHQAQPGRATSGSSARTRPPPTARQRRVRGDRQAPGMAETTPDDEHLAPTAG